MGSAHIFEPTSGPALPAPAPKTGPTGGVSPYPLPVTAGPVFGVGEGKVGPETTPKSSRIFEATVRANPLFSKLLLLLLLLILLFLLSFLLLLLLMLLFVVVVVPRVFEPTAESSCNFDANDGIVVPSASRIGGEQCILTGHHRR